MQHLRRLASVGRLCGGNKRHSDDAAAADARDVRLALPSGSPDDQQQRLVGGVQLGGDASALEQHAVELEAKVNALQLRIHELEEAASASAASSGSRNLEEGASASAVDSGARIAHLVAQAKAAKAELGGVDSRERHDKFAESTFTLAYTSLSAFYGGLETRVGAPNPNLHIAMRLEHCTAADSADEFMTSNYGISTTPEIEWYYVVDPQAGLTQLQRASYPQETRDIEDDHKRSANPSPLGELLPRLASKNGELRQRGEPELLEEELVAGRLYTGPMFQKYNLVCRAAIDEAPSCVVSDFESSCKGNRYTTTLHVLNSLVVKCSKLTKAEKVYRGMAKGVLPETFWQPNEHGVRGGVEAAFMSTTTSRNVALGYATRRSLSGREATPMLFEMQQGMIDRGAKLEWLSQYPHEEEILFAPLTCIEMRAARTEESAIVFDMALSINLMAPTIEKVVSKLKNAQLDLLRLLTGDFAAHGVPAAALAPLERQIEAIRERDGPWFNDAANFQKATAATFVARDGVLRWMVEDGLRAPCPRAYAALATSVDAELIAPLVKGDAVVEGAEVLVYEERLIRWLHGVVTHVGTTVDVTVGGWNKLEKLPRTKALMVREDGAGALLREAAAAGNAALVDALIQSGVSVLVANDKATTPLHLAAAGGHVAICRALLAKGADAAVRNARVQTAEMMARSNSQHAVARLFCPQHSDKEFTEAACTATQRLQAAWAGDLDVLAMTEEGDGKITALMVASRAKQLAAVEALLASSRINAQSASGCTALYLAAEEGSDAIVRLLLGGGADVALYAADGGTPLHLACYFGHEACVRLLLGGGAAVDAALSDGSTASTALMLACENGHAASVRLLLGGGAAVVAAESDGWTALMFACQNGHEACVRLLLEAGAPKDAKTQEGSTALLLAQRNKHTGICELLTASSAP